MFWFHNADADDWCIAYKDRGDDSQEAKTFNSVDEWKKFTVSDVVEYVHKIFSFFSKSYVHSLSYIIEYIL